MNVVLGNADRPGDGVVTILLPIPRKEYDHSLGLLRELEIGNAVKEDCWIG